MTAAIVVAIATTASAQLETAAAARVAAEQRYQIGQVERVLEGAVEHALTATKDRLVAVAQVPAELLVSDNARVRGFRLEGYGIFFDVAVPSFETTLTWSLRTLDQNDLGFDNALRTLQAFVAKSGDRDLDQAMRRIQLQMRPTVFGPRGVAQPASGRAAGSASVGAASVDPAPAAAPGRDPILDDPNEAYRGEVTQALKDAMLEHSSSLGIGPNEWLTIAAKGNDDRPRLAPADSDARTRIIRMRGSDLAAFRAQQITREEALTRIEVRVF